MELHLAKKRPRPKQVVFDGAKLREHRTNAELTQTALADLADVHAIDISRYERGEVEPTLAVAVRLARALGVDVNRLLQPVKPETNPPAPPADSVE